MMADELQKEIKHRMNKGLQNAPNPLEPGPTERRRRKKGREKFRSVRPCANCGEHDAGQIKTLWKACPKCVAKGKEYDPDFKVVKKQSNLQKTESMNHGVISISRGKCPMCGELTKVVYVVNGSICSDCLKKAEM